MKPTIPDNSAKSIRALASLIGYSHSTVRDWLRRSDWPFGRAPFAATVVEEIRAWALSDDRDRRINPPPRRPTAPASTGLPYGHVRAPGFPIIAANLIDPDCPWFVRPKFGRLFDELTPPDLDSLATWITSALTIALADAGEARGEPGVMATGTPAYYLRQLKAIDLDSFDRTLNGLIVLWLARRFIGRKWWQELPEPIDPPRFTDLEPLPHMARGASQ